MLMPDKDYKRRPAWSSNVLSLVLRGPGIRAGIVSRVVCKNLGKNDQTTNSCADSNLRYSAVCTNGICRGQRRRRSGCGQEQSDYRSARHPKKTHSVK
jgi:hypothetical protein